MSGAPPDEPRMPVGRSLLSLLSDGVGDAVENVEELDMDDTNHEQGIGRGVGGTDYISWGRLKAGADDAPGVRG